MTSHATRCSRHISGLAPLLVALWALAFAVVAMRGCDVAEPDEHETLGIGAML